VLLWLEFGVGRWLRTGRWPELSMAEARALTWWGVGGDLVVGSLLTGAVLGAAFGVVAWFRIGRGAGDSFRRALLEETSERYAECGVFHWEFVRGKLRHDPLYAHVLSPGRLPNAGRLLDLGCGRGILLVALRAARKLRAEDDGLELVGVEADGDVAAVARRALGDQGRIQHLDLSDYDPESCDVAVLFDVLHYLAPAVQERLLVALCSRLRSGGRLLIREPDDRPPWRFRLTRWQERFSALVRRDWRRRFYFRGAVEWTAILERQGLAVETSELWHGTPFSNVLIEAVKP
jgi:SAM-dependent methyltransferase